MHAPSKLILQRLAVNRFRSHKGFTVVEILVTLVISAIVSAAAAGAIFAYWRYAAQLEARNRLQDQWGQVSFLISTEIAEARTIAAGGTCGDTPSLTLEIPSEDASIDGDPTDDVTIVGYGINNQGELLRCGVPFDRFGEVDFAGASIDVILVNNVPPNNGLIFDPDNNRYTLTLEDPISGVSYRNQSSGSRTRARVIDDP